MNYLIVEIKICIIYVFLCLSCQKLNGQNTIHDNIAIGSKSLKNNFSGNKNMAIGNSALLNNNEGVSNIAIGITGQISNTSSNENLSIGHFSMVNNKNHFNLAIGNESLMANDTGTLNYAIGLQTLKSNTMGYLNCAFGNYVLTNNSMGYSNSGFGNFSLTSNIIGSNNTGFGAESLYYSTGNDNTAIGIGSQALHNAGSRNTSVGIGTFSKVGAILNSGDDNVAFGEFTLGLLIEGERNTAVGSNALLSTNIGIDHTAIGWKAKSFSFSNSSAIGNSTTCSASNQIKIGNSNVNKVEGAVNYTISDKRFKSNIKNYNSALGFILSLRPVSYNFNYLDYSKYIGEADLDSVLLTNKSLQLEIGLIAQEVEQACKDFNIDFSNLIHKPLNENGYYSLSYETMVSPIVQAVKEQQLLIEKYFIEIDMFDKLMQEAVEEIEDETRKWSSKIKKLK